MSGDPVRLLARGLGRRTGRLHGRLLRARGRLRGDQAGQGRHQHRGAGEEDRRHGRGGRKAEGTEGRERSVSVIKNNIGN